MGKAIDRDLKPVSYRLELEIREAMEEIAAHRSGQTGMKISHTDVIRILVIEERKRIQKKGRKG